MAPHRYASVQLVTSRSVSSASVPAAALSIDVVIPTWNRIELILALLRSLSLQTVRHTVFVVDNGSVDGTAGAIAKEFPDVELIALDSNHGFGRAVNRGVARGRGDYIVLVNNDCDCGPDFLERITAPFRHPSRPSSVAGVLVDPDGRVGSAGIRVDPTLAGIGYLYQCQVTEVAGHPPPLGPCGGAAAYRRDVWQEMGGFDEEIFAYSEDVELAMRLHANGHLCALAAEARVQHAGSQTLGRGGLRQLRMAGWARGYVLGRYRVGPLALILEVLLSLLDSARRRTLLPVTVRWLGWRRGRGLPRRQHLAGAGDASLREGLLYRLRA